MKHIRLGIEFLKNDIIFSFEVVVAGERCIPARFDLNNVLLDGPRVVFFRLQTVDAVWTLENKFKNENIVNFCWV